jgi:DNA-binding NtrC family response regulator
MFLDEIGELSLMHQSKLLRVLEQREIMRVGSTRQRTLDVRFLAATNRNLDDQIAEGRFRQDLYFRLKGVVLTIRPLRRRIEDIGPLAVQFAREARARDGPEARALDVSPVALEMLRAHTWPGNVRELRNAIELAVLLCDGETIECEHLHLAANARSQTCDTCLDRTTSLPLSSPSSSRVPVDPEQARTLDALEKCGWNQVHAARSLGISRGTLAKRMDAMSLPRPRKRRASQPPPF